MKIVVPDPIFLTEEDRRRLDRLGKVEIFETYPADAAAFQDRIRDAEVVVVGRYGIDAAVAERVTEAAAHCRDTGVRSLPARTERCLFIPKPPPENAMGGRPVAEGSIACRI
ncbi:hypothetical protein ABH15_09185 [Methanoculleus taiwanensis]|uniref:D-isomer specific 2-hydroxyacid dehydrogenase catalytic domain-containing protein n=1 Tax=Methanoculleus taiwanensis TaxID=1550565 RepID=A0A498H052_9EURY|nr:hypothetical protein [Methanoculleus taiwanensis]RXE56289.1 hypothetical protein ABH15_09185 [Methanoculleus taiwanensis]